MDFIIAQLEKLNFSQEEQKDFKHTLDTITYLDRQKIIRALKNIKSSDSNLEERKIDIWLSLSEAKERINKKIALEPYLAYDKSLPVSLKHDEIVKAIKEHQVIILAGETGSGKTTQLPKMCLEAGLGIRGLIGHTQPRRIAARSVANRIANEMHETLGQSVGFKVRFNDLVGDQCKIKLMTDGILLSEIAHDRLLLNYDCIIIDEAHERSLNIDFLLGYMKGILKKRPELKLIITSATIDLKRFSDHFDNAPIIEVEGRTFPVEVVYMPLLQEIDDEGETIVREIDLNKGILNAINYLMGIQRADVLVFLPGEREIAEVKAFLSKQHLKDIEILPLYARLAYSEQSKIFQAHQNVRVILSTNVAETSLTVPSIKYVIDVGLARISRYSPRTKIQRLPIEPISQSSANQRKGRCGRVSNGICVRLYEKSDFDNRPQYTDAEILRSNLGSVILQMVYMHLGDIHSFPFIDRPADRQINDGLRLLYEIGAIKQVGKDTKNIDLTSIGYEIAKIPTDPRLARMIVESSKKFCLNETLIIASALAASDPREYPIDRREAANNAHAKFKDENSDFIGILKLYNYLKDKQSSLSKRAFSNEIKGEFISYLRVKEWFDLHLQLKLICKNLGYTFNEVDADYESLHKSLLSGLLSHIGMQTSTVGEYQGAYGIKFAIFPTSGLFKKKLKWLLANEIAETSKLYARTVAKIEPEWAYDYAKHLVKKTYHDVFFSKDKGSAVAYMNVNLFSLPIISKKKVIYNRIDPKISRELFIKEGLIYGNLNCKHPFFIQNRELIDDLVDLENKVRNKDLIVDESVLYDFYDSRIPQNITCQIEFDRWYKKQVQQDKNFLKFSFEDVTKDKINLIKEEEFPDYFYFGDIKLKLSYIFDPTDERDGVSVHIPISVVNQIKVDPFLYQVPGLQNELYAALIKSLPKKLRKNLIPAPDFAKALKERLEGCEGNLFVNAAQALTKIGGMLVTEQDFDLSLIDKHLFMTFVIEDLNGKELAYGKNFHDLANKLQGKLKETLNTVINKSEATNKNVYTEWNFGNVQEQKSIKKGSMEIIAYPAITDKGDGVSIELYDSKVKQQQAMEQGVRRLIFLSIKNPTSYLQAHLPNRAKLSMYYKELGSVNDLINDLCLCTIDTLIKEHGGYSFKQDDFEKLLAIIKSNLNDKALEIALIVETILLAAHEVKKQLSCNISLQLALMYKDCKANLNDLIYKGFIVNTTLEHLSDVPRYLQTILHRLKRGPLDPTRDLNYQRKLDDVIDRYRAVLSKYKTLIPQSLKELKWTIQELRVSFFAQTLGVKGSVSEKRILAEIDRILKEEPPTF